MASLGVKPKRRSQDQVTVLDSRLAPKDTPSSLNISIALNLQGCERRQHSLVPEIITNERIGLPGMTTVIEWMVQDSHSVYASNILQVRSTCGIGLLKLFLPLRNYWRDFQYRGRGWKAELGSLQVCAGDIIY